MTISVVIPAYNEEKLLPLCLDSLVKQKTKHSFEVIVVNNNSTDRTKEVAKSYQNKLNLLVLDETKKGRGMARYVGFKKAKGTLILSTDADAVVPPLWVETMVNAFSDPKVVAIAGSCRIEDLSFFQNTVFNFAVPLSMKFYHMIFGYYLLGGYNFAIRKNVYEKTGGFNQKLNAQEDTELSLRVKKLGKIILLDNLIITYSGRRFNKGFMRGWISYYITCIKYFLFKNSNIELSDVRD